jgi:hypothetical protein
VSAVAFWFFAVPNHRLGDLSGPLAPDELLEPDSPDLRAHLERALGGVEFRDVRAKDRARALSASDASPSLPSLRPGLGPAAIFAQPPGDLPALLRMADGLDRLAEQEAGERALVWQCGGCRTRYAVPVALVRNVAIRCERCGEAVELNPSRSLGEEALVDPLSGRINTSRARLASFLREAMARGWPVLVCALD